MAEPYEDPYAEPPRREFARADLVAASHRGVVTPDLMCDDLMYPGKVHSIAGPPEAGKTTVALWMASQVLADGGTVAFFDEESGADMTVDKMMALGCGDADLANLHYYPFPNRAWNGADIAELHELHDKTKPVLTIFDSVGAFMALAGMDENSSRDTSRFYMQVILPLARQMHSAVLLIDHDAKGSENGKDTGSRYARGSGAKLGAIDVMYKLTPKKAFSRSVDGEVLLTITKDRPGWLNPRRYRLTITSALDVRFSEVHGSADDVGEVPGIKLAPAEQKLMSCLNENPAGIKRMIDRMSAKHGHGLQRETVSRAMARLTELGFAEVIHAGGQGRGDEALWRRKMPGEQPLIPAGDIAPLDTPGSVTKP